MADHSRIEWTEATWNPVVGCTLASPGCTHCYAMTMARRIEAMQPASHYAGTTKVANGKAVWTGKIAIGTEHVLTQPLRWRRPRKIFVNSMGDLFHEGVPDAWIDHVFAVMALCPQHTFQLLTKRSARMREYLTNQPVARRRWEDVLQAMGILHRSPPPILPNVWLGVSTEDQCRADERVPDLLATPAAVRFISAEPLLGPIDLTRVGRLDTVRAAFPNLIDDEARRRPQSGPGSVCGYQIEAVGAAKSSIEFFQTPDHMGGFTAASPRRFPRLDLVIVGGESGPNARPMHPDWARALRDQCASAGVPFFFKQWGEFREFDTGVGAHHEVENDSYAADAYLSAAINPCWITPAGRHITRRTDLPDDETPCRLIERVGKRAAGRRLDGIEHNGMPEARP